MHVSVVVAVVVLSSALLPGGWALPGGAPSGACFRIWPEGHAGPSQDLDTSPYTLNVSSLSTGYYVPGQTYTLTLSGSQIYRGLLVQARVAADVSPVGSFAAESDVTRLSSCSRPDSAITHSGRDDKTSTDLVWTAPPAGTGPLQFLYAVVEINRGGVSRFWATARSAVIVEHLPEPPEPLTVSFTGDTPIVVGSTVTAQVSVSRSAPLLCQIVSRDSDSGVTVIDDEKDCASGEVTFLNVSSGYHRVRVIAGEEEAVVRSRVFIRPDNPDFCSLNAINEGITLESEPSGDTTAVIEFRSIGQEVGFFCNINRGPEFFSCTSPLRLLDVQNNDVLKVIPDPRVCTRGNRRALRFKLTAP